MINKNEVEKIAKLARLGLMGQEIKKFQRDLSAILDYFEKLKKVDVSGIAPTSHSIEIENIMRDDIKTQKPKVTTSKLVDLMPEAKDNYLKVKSIF